MIHGAAKAWLKPLAGASILVLAACAPQPTNFSPGDGTRASMGQADQPAAGQRLAITHSFTLRLPSTEVEAIQQKHLAACGKLGCTVLSTRLDRSNERLISARSSVRIAPSAYAEFTAIITAPPARVVTHSESAEDKTVPMLDIEKRLDVKSALRDRLTAMLRDPAAKSVGDLVAIEKELAQVQADIEAATAQRDYLRTITDTVRIDINYNGQAALVAGIDLSPIAEAARGSGRTMVASVAALISFLAAALPWLPLIAFLAWAVRRGLRRWRARTTAA